MALFKNGIKTLTLSLLFINFLFFPFGNAFLENVGQAFGQLGDQLNGFVDGLYKNVDSWADHVIDHAKSEECQHICPESKKLVKNLAYEHQPTGCGTFGIQIKESDLPLKEMRHCCDGHQMCYHNCGTIKNECDDQLHKCLLKQCKKSNKDEALLKGCRTASKLLLMGCLTFGCKSFKDSQKNACVCVGNDEL